MSLRLALIRQRYNPFGGAERFVEPGLGGAGRGWGCGHADYPQLGRGRTGMASAS